MKLERRKGAIIRPFNAKLRSLAVGPTTSSVCCFVRVTATEKELEHRDGGETS